MLALFAVLALSSPRSLLIATLLIGAAIAVRRVNLAAMLALAFTAALLQVATGDVTPPGDLAYAIFFFDLGSARAPRVRLFGLICAAAAVVVAGVWFALREWSPGSWRTGLFNGLAFGALAAIAVFGGYIAGYLRWQGRQAVQARVDAELANAEQRRLGDLFEQQQERNRIATDVHDLAAHSWAVVAAQADGARYLFSAGGVTDADRVIQALSYIGDAARSAMSDVRALLGQLRASEDGTGALGFEREEVLVERMRTSGMDLHLVRRGKPPDSTLLQMSARRVLAECLTNALKHGDLTQPVRVEEDWHGGYHLRVENAAPVRRQPTQGHGLRGMAERMALVDGTFEAASHEGVWVIEARAPRGGEYRGDPA